MCCGRNRTQMRTAASPPPRPAVNAAPQKPPAHVSFVYLGNTAMTVKGPITGREYSFDRPGSRVEVDWRDRVLLASIRQLRQVV
jgi:uncharacterized OB-fold protein